MSKEFLSRLHELKFKKLKSLKLSVLQVRDRSDKILKKIENEGIAGYYSINDEILRYSIEAWRHSQSLGELKTLEASLKPVPLKKKTKNKSRKKKTDEN
jgi:transcriptional accessory protein Tex/SPT6|tara:strand:- start:444 stop:740 length:297 start_codon:yes stop_codon:yes gene_type:complete